MNEQPKPRRFLISLLALVLWLVTFVLGLECIYVLREIFYLIYISMGGSIVKAESFALGLVFILAIASLVFFIGTAEYHRKRPGTRESWRLFAWTIAIEVSLIVLYYILLFL